MIVLISQVYPPDAAAVGQYFEDVAIEMAERGHEVLVLTADRDYDDPSIRYDSSSRHRKVRVARLPYSSFGKKSLLHRLIGQFSFLLQVSVRLIFNRKVKGVLLTTIPATTGVFFLFVRLIRKLPYVYWVMDINPDQAVAIGALSKKHPAAYFLGASNKKLIRDANHVVCLDKDMVRVIEKSRINPAKEKLSVLPPWPLEKDLGPVSRHENPFISRQQLSENLIIMYSGNHSMVHPLDTLLEAIEKIKLLNKNICFAFIGGGRGKIKVEAKMDAWGRTQSQPDRVTVPGNEALCLSLPYQPLDQIRFTLSAADVHVVSFGTNMVGIVHPSKFYGALSLGKPILLLGPRRSVLGKLIIKEQIGWCVEHGDLDGMQKTILQILALPFEQIQETGTRCRRLATNQFSRSQLCGKFCDLMEETFTS